MARDKPKQRKATPVTGRYTPTERTLAFRKAAKQRRAENLEITKRQRELKKAKLDAAIARADAECARLEAAKRAAQKHVAPTDGTAAPETPADSELGAEDSTE